MASPKQHKTGWEILGWVMKKGSVCADVHRHLEKVGADGHQSSVGDGHKAELTHGGHGSLEPGQLCSLLGFYCCPVEWGRGTEKGA